MTNPTQPPTETELCDRYIAAQATQQVPAELYSQFAENFGLNKEAAPLHVEDYRACDWSLGEDQQYSEHFVRLKSVEQSIDWSIGLISEIIYLGSEHSLLCTVNIGHHATAIALVTNSYRRVEDEDDQEDRCASGHTN